jgi:flagellar biosynthesis protein FlhG
VDADLGGANLHTLLGIRTPERGLADFMERRVQSLDDVVVPTKVPNLRFINSAEDILGIANPKFSQKTRLLSHLDRLSADVILLDLGAGTSTTILDFFLYAAGKIAVVTPQVTSIQNAYGFIKASVYRKLVRVFSHDAEVLEMVHATANSGYGTTMQSVADLRAAVGALSEDHQALFSRCLDELQISLVVNMVRGSREREAARVVSNVAERYLGVSPDVLGHVDYDPELDRSINAMSTYLTGGGPSSARVGIYDITSKVLQRLQQGVAGASEPVFEPEGDPALA